jgi:3-deoxy-D-manno-octulosonic-acid transferase
LPSLAYRTVLRLSVATVPFAARFSAKLARGHAGRRGVVERLVAWGRERRDTALPLVWFHAPSVGEGLQARAVIERLRARRPDWQVLYTHFSPSAEALARSMPAEMADYLPWDTHRAMDSVVQALAPDAVVFTKLDLWPELAVQAAARGAAVVLAAATVSPASGRLRWPVRAVLRPGHAVVSAAGAVSQPDAGRLARLGVPAGRIRVLGDPRCDSVMDAVGAVAADEPLLRYGSGAVTLVAGSTWPGDEAVLLDAFRAVRDRHPTARLILAPHEPTVAHLRGVEDAARARGLPAPVRLSETTEPVPVLLVDRLGVLARLYGAGEMAYVGGGFGRAGLHSVLEPAAWGRPVVFGPRWQTSRDAALLLDAGAGVALPAGFRRAVAALAARWNDWIVDARGREEAGSRALAVVREGVGAAERNAALVEEAVMAPRSPRPRSAPSAAPPGPA